MSRVTENRHAADGVSVTPRCQMCGAQLIRKHRGGAFFGPWVQQYRKGARYCSGACRAEGVPHAPQRRCVVTGRDRARRRDTAPATSAAGRLFGRLAPALIIVALALAGRYLPRECFNEHGQPKIRHKTREEAQAHRQSLMRATGQPGHALKVYQCGQCGFWHVGHGGRRRRRGGGSR
jgi:hypothetical protein